MEGPAPSEGDLTTILPQGVASGKEATRRWSDPGQAFAKSIAVLPFANMSADAETEYFCDGLAEELLNALAKIEKLKVAARTSAFSFKRKSASVGEIARALNVATVLEGSVSRSNDRVRVTGALAELERSFSDRECG